MVSTLCDKIREENKRKYGTHVSVYGQVVFANLYSDRTHFVYELLQNAEDACERARKKGQKGRFHVSFELYPDRLEVRHNGIPFDENDVRGICGIVEAKKDKEIVQIGKFGIGFKSVYVYTTSPEVYSGDTICHSCIKCAFCIKDYVHPYPIKPREDVLAGETLFVIRFDKEEVQKVAYSEIGSRLRNLGIRTLLFLNNLEEISYKTGSTAGKYLRRSKTVDGARQTSLYYVEEEEERQIEKWLIFDKALSRDKSRKLEIAYLSAHDSQSKKDRIIPATKVKLFAYFSTEKETHLRFLIQGPYNTTPARDNIRNDKWNRELIEETSTLVSDSISKIKTLNLLDVEFLRTLPIDTEHFTQESTMFKPVYEKVKEKLLSDEALLPAYDRSFTTASQAFIARGKDLCLLLTGEQLDTLFERKGSKWFDENITEVRTPELRKYLMNELEIKEVDPELFARKFNVEFISKQSDQWVTSFYRFLLDQKALWKAPTYSYERPSLLRSKPIIRLNDNSHTPPFDEDGKPIVYLPHKDPSIRKLFPKTVKDTIARDKKAKEFLKALSVNEPDKAAAISNLVLPLYGKMKTVSEKENIKHVEWILKTLEDCEGSKRNSLLGELKETPFLYATNASSQQKEYKEPTKIHIGEKFTSNRNLEIYFEGNNEIWFLDERYLALMNKEILEKFTEMGCKSGIRVWCRKPDFLNRVIIADYWGLHRRGLDGFDPDCKVEELEHALQNINIERSKIIWRIAKKYCRSINGEVESCPRQNYEGSTKKWQFSKMGKLLTEYPWLPDSSGSSFHKTSEITLSELPDDFDKKNLEAKYAAEKLGFQSEFDQEIQELLEKTPDEAKEILEIYMTASPEIQQRILESARTIKVSGDKLQEMELPEMEASETTTISVSPSPSELEAEFKRSLTQDRPLPISTENKTWTGPTPEEEQKMREFARETMAKLVKKPQYIEKGHKEVSYIKTKGEEEPMLRKFLLEQYKGHCQVCNVKLDLGPNKDPYFEIYRLIEKHRLYGTWSNQEFNVLCLCPNCHALMKYGGRNLQELFNKARRVAENEEAPEEVDERRGDFYITQITMAGKQTELFYTPFHMAKISAFIKIIGDKVQRDTSTLTEEEALDYVHTVSEPKPATYSAESDSDICKGCLCFTCPEKGVYEECGPCPCSGFPDNPSKTTDCYLRKGG